VVVVADAAVVFAGDLLEEAGPPVYGDDSYPLEWPATAHALADRGAATYIPGHGDIMSAAEAFEQAEAIATVAALIRELHAAGLACEEALDEAAHQWPYPPQTLTDAVRRGYQALDWNTRPRRPPARAWYGPRPRVPTLPIPRHVAIRRCHASPSGTLGYHTYWPDGGRAYYLRKQAEGKSRKEAMRALKRRISDAVYQRLITDAHR
jgi:hypothetical protein